MAFISRPTGEALRTIGTASSVGFAFVLSIAFGAGLGYGLDRWLGTSPWMLLVGLVIGVAAGIRSVFRIVASLSKPKP